MDSKDLNRVQRILDVHVDLCRMRLASELQTANTLRGRQLAFARDIKSTRVQQATVSVPQTMPQDVFERRAGQLQTKLNELQPVLARAALQRHSAQEALSDALRKQLSVSLLADSEDSKKKRDPDLPLPWFVLRNART